MKLSRKENQNLAGDFSLYWASGGERNGERNSESLPLLKSNKKLAKTVRILFGTLEMNQRLATSQEAFIKRSR